MDLKFLETSVAASTKFVVGYPADGNSLIKIPLSQLYAELNDRAYIDQQINQIVYNFPLAEAYYDLYFVTACAKNEFNKETMVVEGYYISIVAGLEGTINADADSAMTDYIDCLPEQAYTLSGIQWNQTMICFYDASKTLIGYSKQGTPPKSCTTPAGCLFVRFNLSLNKDPFDFDSVQWEKGSTATAYEAYYLIASLKPNVTVSKLKGCTLSDQASSSDAVVSKGWIESNFVAKDNEASGMFILKEGEYLFVRTTYDSTRDLVQKLSVYPSVPTIGNNNVFNFLYTYLIPSGNVNTNSTTMLTSAVTIHLCGDDSAPVYYNESYLGANHGLSKFLPVTVASHDKDVTDIGSTWKDSAGKVFYLVLVRSSTELWFMPANTGTAELWRFNNTYTGPTLTHFADASHPNVITIAGISSSQLEPIIKNRTIEATTDDLLSIVDDGQYFCTGLTVRCKYDIFNPVSLLEYVLSHKGEEPDFDAPDIQVSIDLHHRFDCYGGCTINVSHHYKQAVKLSTDMMGLQAGVIATNGTFPHLYVNIPNVAPITVGATTYDFSDLQLMDVAPSAAIVAYKANWLSPSIAPYSLFEYIGSDANTLDVCFGMLYDISKGSLKHATRIPRINYSMQIVATKKAYMNAFDAAHTVTANSYYTSLSYRGYTKPGLYSSLATSVLFFQYGSSLFVSINYNQSCSHDIITLPDAFQNGAIEIIEQSSGIIIHNEFMKRREFEVSNSESKGYVILRVNL